MGSPPSGSESIGGARPSSSVRVRIPTGAHPLARLGSTTGCQPRSVRLLDDADEADRDTADPYHQSKEGAEGVQLAHDQTQNANGHARNGKGCACAQIDPSSPSMVGRDLVVSSTPSVSINDSSHVPFDAQAWRT